MICPRVVIFDLDDTLSPPHVPVAPEHAEKLLKLLSHMPVAIVTAAPFPRIDRDLLQALSLDKSLSNLHVFSENAAQCRQWQSGTWKVAYEKTITNAERSTIKKAIADAIKETGALEGVPIYGERILDREAGVTLSTLGLGAPQAARESWDPEMTRRQKLYNVIKRDLPAWHVFIGGLTSIDISRADVSKAQAVEWLNEHLKVPTSEMLYVGDALYEGGNDAVVISTGIPTRSVANPAETLTVLDELLTACES